MQPTDTTTDARRRAWSQYWAQGALHSLPGTLDLQLDGPPRAFWREAFAALPDGARVLDIGTGNGALPRLASDVAGPHRALDLVGIDIADVQADAAGYPPCHAVAFRSRCEAEALPFDGGCFDLVTSQFGLEYTRLEASLPEVARVLSPGGRIALLMHDARSVIAGVAREEAAHAQRLAGPGGFVPLLSELVAALAPGSGGHSTADARAAAFAAALEDLEQAIRASATPELLRQAHALAQEAMRLCAAGRCDQAASIVAQAQATLELVRLRAQELVEAALDAGGVEAMGRRLHEAGVSITDVVPIHHANGALLGVGMRGVRAGG